jgi:hypothetical protein
MFVCKCKLEKDTKHSDYLWIQQQGSHYGQVSITARPAAIQLVLCILVLGYKSSNVKFTFFEFKIADKCVALFI